MKLIHPNFKLGNYTDALDLESCAKILSKSKEIYKAEIGIFLLQWLDNSKELKVKTSGSTGVSKEIILSKKAMICSAKKTGDFFDLKEYTKVFLCLPAAFIAGKMMLVRAMVLGWKIDINPLSSKPLENVFKSYDFCAMTPMQAQNSIDKLQQIKTLLIGGAKVSSALKQNLIARNITAYETYGMTETITHIAVRRINEKYFKALSNVSFSQDERGCLEIQSPDILRKTLKTNDIIQLISDKSFEWLGRYDNIINSGGIKFQPEIIESRIEHLISYKYFISSLPDDYLGQKIVLLLEADNSCARQIKNKIRNVLKKNEMPKNIFCLEEFKMLDSGKIDKKRTLQLIF